MHAGRICLRHEIITPRNEGAVYQKKTHQQQVKAAGISCRYSIEKKAEEHDARCNLATYIPSLNLPEARTPYLPSGANRELCRTHTLLATLVQYICTWLVCRRRTNCIGFWERRNGWRVVLAPVGRTNPYPSAMHQFSCPLERSYSFRALVEVRSL